MGKLRDITASIVCRLLVVAAALTVCSCAHTAPTTGDTRRVLDSLDNLLEHKEDYVRLKEKRIADIKSALDYPNLSDLNKYVTYTQLYQEYWKFDLDSAVHYAKLGIWAAERMNDDYRKIQSEFQLSISYSMHGMYRQAEQILNKYNPNNVPADLRSDYYNANIMFFTYYMYTSDLPEDLQLLNSYRDSLNALRLRSSVEYRINAAAILNGKEKKEAYIKILNEVDRYSPVYARVANFIATNELDSPNPDIDECKRYLMRSAITDLYNATRENHSMYMLAQILYNEGDYGRAYRYAQSSFHDAITAGIQFRLTQVSNFYSIVTDVYQDREAQAKGWLVVTLIAACVLLACLVLSVFFIFKQLRKIMKIRRRLSESNEELQRLNEALNSMNLKLHDNNSQLEETNSIKEQYIGQFFNICSGYIDKIGEYQKDLHKLAVNKRYDELVKRLRSTTLIDEETEALYHHFDTIFLNLYPNFVEEVNAMMRSDEKIVLKPNVLLNKELRILALLRLGITDSDKIASFLHCSISTVYNYRTKMRNKTTADDKSFEERIMAIQSTPKTS